MSPQYSALPTKASNHLCFHISNIGVTFINQANLLSEMHIYDLYTMSKRNRLHQSYNEFRGVVRDVNGSEYLSLGYISQYSFQASLNVGALKSTAVFGDTATTAACQLNIVCGYGGVLVTQQGSSASMSGLLTKNLVLDTKESGLSVRDKQQVDLLAGENIGLSLISLSTVIKKER